MSTCHQLSHAQEALWFLYELDPEGSSYNTGVAVRVLSPVELPALREAVAAAVARHELVHSLFDRVDGVPVSTPRAHEPFALLVEDLGPVGDDELRTAVRRALNEPYHLRDRGAFRFVLLRRSETDAVLLIGGHHIASDAVSDLVLLRDILAGYQQAVAGEEAAPAPVAYTHDTYVAAEQRLLSSPRGARAEAFWHGVIEGAQPAQIPTDRPRTAGPTPVGATHHLELDAGQVEALRTAARACGVTLFSFLLGAFQGLLHRYTRQNDFLIGCPTTTRLSPPMRDVVGNYINTLVFRGSFAPGATFRDAATTVDGQVRQGLAAVGYPFARLTRTANRPRTSAGSSLCQITFNLIGVAKPDPLMKLLLDGEGEHNTIEHHGLTISPFELPQAEGQLDLAVNVRQSSDCLTLDFRYNAVLFDLSTIERFASYYVRALDTAAADPDQVISRLRLVQVPAPSRPSDQEAVRV
ncbi:condensation domain-containing protein [Kitasatospora sp. NPDC058063]|uniref:condensation domain-containing protein n=1 Tax=unclassified Kitasatospora TaxID=2633591 RepID=UPI0036DCBF8E